jgi:hypothetical protein
MDLWLPSYEHRPIGGAGLSAGPGRRKAILHTTETAYGSMDFLINHWRTNWGSGLPHFIAEGDRYVQLLPLNVGAYTLENAPGGADTNRSGPAIQVEIVGYSANGFNDVEYEALGRWLADLVKAGTGIDVRQHPRFYGANEGVVLASYSSPIRMSARQYDEFNGFCGHQHTPENAHWDPGKLDADRVERIALSHLAPAPVVAPAPTPAEEDMAPPIYRYVDGSMFVLVPSNDPLATRGFGWHTFMGPSEVLDAQRAGVVGTKVVQLQVAGSEDDDRFFERYPILDSGLRRAAAS